jgi:hypothetical protein
MGRHMDEFHFIPHDRMSEEDNNGQARSTAEHEI